MVPAMRKTPLAIGSYYHIYNRGVDKRIIFTSRREYERFIACLYLLNTHDAVRPADVIENKSLAEILLIERGEPLVAIGAFCLMPNHFHLYLTPLVEGGVSKFMQRLQTAYTMYFNERHKRSGSLLQGTFRAELMTTDEQAHYLYFYIHLNPAKLLDPDWREWGVKDFKKAKEFVCSYPYSSIGEYSTNNHCITDPRAFPAYFVTKKDIEDHIDIWLTRA